MKWAIDRFENNTAILENIFTKQKKEVSINELPLSIREGSILKLENNQYKLDNKTETKRRLDIKERFKKLRKQ